MQKGSLPVCRHGSQNKPQGWQHWKSLDFLWNISFFCSISMSSWPREELACCHGWLAAVYSSIVLSQQWSVHRSRKHLSLRLYIKEDDHLVCFPMWGYHEVNPFMKLTADYFLELQIAYKNCFFRWLSAYVTLMLHVISFHVTNAVCSSFFCALRGLASVMHPNWWFDLKKKKKVYAVHIHIFRDITDTIPWCFRTTTMRDDDHQRRSLPGPVQGSFVLKWAFPCHNWL